ncbi:hypothetical protein KP509_31G000800 [Ceratopteris richardii]|uniref:B box-type domain-containing protein n=1 Tax=Ceratopteris richardii TaxID=49495 RepID=A0A8T2QWR3_CERRI|nr:hypothetical protein KP509_31G000800 [Ceratopteris richardii]
MKLLCDVCENAVASLVCCADEAALCLACDSRVHAANKLANKHLRVPLLAENCDPPSCDICQDKSSFFFCVEDRALLCRECDESIHSANPLAAKHRRFLLTGIKVGSGTNGNTLQEISSIDQQATSSLADNANPTTRSLTGSQEVVKSARDISNNDGGLNSTWTGSRNPFPPVQGTQSSSPPLPAADGKGFGRYTITKDGTLSMASNNVNDAYRSEAGTSTDKPNGTTISIQRISAGQMAPFVAPVLSSIRASLAREEAPNNRSMKHIESTSIKATKCPVSGNREDSNNKSLMMIDVQTSQHTGSSSISDYLNSSLPGWRLDELLTDLVDVCDSRRSPSPPKVLMHY